MLQALLRPGDRARITAIPGHSCWDAASLGEALPSRAEQLEPGGDPEADLQWLTASSTAADGALPVVAGSLHLLGWLIPRLDPPL